MGRTFLGINLKNWLTILGLVITIFVILLGVTTKINATQSQTISNSVKIEKCETQIQSIESDISDIKGDIKEINGKLDILIRK